MPDNGTGGGFESNPPIIVQGGGSIDVDVPSKFKEKSGGPNGKHFKNDVGNLVSIVVDGGAPIRLKKDSRIVINYE